MLHLPTAGLYNYIHLIEVVVAQGNGCRIRFPLEEMKYLFKCIFPFLRSGVEAMNGVEFRHSTRNGTHANLAESGERSVLKPLFLPCCVWDTAWSWRNTFNHDKLIFKNLKKCNYVPACEDPIGSKGAPVELEPILAAVNRVLNYFNFTFSRKIYV